MSEQGELQRMYGVLGADMDSAFEAQAQLEDHQKEVYLKKPWCEGTTLGVYLI